MSGVTVLSATVSEKQIRYPIYIQSGLLETQGCLDPYIEGTQVLIISDENTACYLPLVKAHLGLYRVSVLVLPAGEKTKTLATVTQVFDELIKGGHHRDTTLLALGGGMIMDLVGFVSACYQRGVACLYLPTSLLGAVDAAIGGKTAVNYGQALSAKNMIGCFSHPKAVLIDPHFMKTLPEREWRSGMAEVIKVAAIRDEDFFRWLECCQNLPGALAEEAFNYLLGRAIQIKLDLVQQDVRDQGCRQLLNFGHTLGHALEAISAFSLTHGEAVSIGMSLASELSQVLLGLSLTSHQRLIHLLQRQGLPTTCPKEFQQANWWQALRLDKKILKGYLKMVLLLDVGQAVCQEVNACQIDALLARVFAI